ncbi:virulence factor [Pedobacter sp. SD-b]|uniref:Virulence factor n=1 Tax=Pedobacter segetis TaxID=2793069 RepID=A0ABS1BJL8_9SPHI|nr:AcvB/VirJ family lysyl-phosphatidylglycerol hydrolase [Pedobacter segetis]MBK0382541.1 virulence factor [Pedobacter segetis]
MKLKNILLFGLFICVKQNVTAQKIDSIYYGRFGKITIYIPAKAPSSVALFISGDGGWEHGVINMAKNICHQNALVLGIDAKFYMNALEKSKADCYYPAADLENLSLMIQKKFHFNSYQKPVLIGYSYGATLAYGILAQAPANTFKGAIAIGFSPDLIIKKPLCKGNGLTQTVLVKNKSYNMDKIKAFNEYFIALNGKKDQECPYKNTIKFMRGIKNAQLVLLENVGHGFSLANHWLPAFDSAYHKILSQPSFSQKNNAKKIFFSPGNHAPNIDDLPLTHIYSEKKTKLPFIIMLSGDGGWTSFDQSYAESLSKLGFNIIGLDAQKYFWNAKTPDKTTLDILKVIVQEQYALKQKNFILAGYSFGASVIPFIADRLPKEVKNNVSGLFSLSPDIKADFEIHISDMLNLDNTEDHYDVLAEFKKINAIKSVICFGESEDEAVRRKFEADHQRIILIPGDHHFDNNFPLLAKSIYKSFIGKQ